VGILELSGKISALAEHLKNPSSSWTGKTKPALSLAKIE
jgi:hypothetical protein